MLIKNNIFCEKLVFFKRSPVIEKFHYVDRILRETGHEFVLKKIKYQNCLDKASSGVEHYQLANHRINKSLA